MTEYPLDQPRDDQFHKSSYSNDHRGCVEVAAAIDGGRWLRDVKSKFESTVKGGQCPIRPRSVTQLYLWQYTTVGTITRLTAAIPQQVWRTVLRVAALVAARYPI